MHNQNLRVVWKIGKILVQECSFPIIIIYLNQLQSNGMLSATSLKLHPWLFAIQLVTYKATSDF